MKNILLLLLSLVVSTTAYAQEVHQKKMCAELYSCSIKTILELDDKVSPANVIADAVPSVCIKETNLCIYELTEDAKAGAIKQDPRVASDIEEIVNSAEWRKKQEQSVKELILPLVLKVRAAEASKDKNDL